MAFVAFNKSSDTRSSDDLRINKSAVLYVETSRPDLVGHTMIHMLGQGSTVNAVTESVDNVVSALSAGSEGLVAATRHYMATPPPGGAATVYISPVNVSFIRPNLPVSPDFWVVRFVDGSELQVAGPIPAGL